MPYSKDFLQYVLEQLGGLRGAVSRRMFGGAGLYYEELFFGLISRDTLYLRVNETNRRDYEALGMTSVSITTRCRRTCSKTRTSWSPGRAARCRRRKPLPRRRLRAAP